MAVTAEVDIANLALDILGVTQKIAALTDATKEAQAANRWYTTCRDLVARALPWRFNKRFEMLMLDGAAFATVTLSNGLAAGDTVTINGVVLTATVTTNPSVGQWAIPETPVNGDADRQTAGQGLVDAIAAHPTLSPLFMGHLQGAVAALNTTVVHVHALLQGSVGNSYTISDTGNGVATTPFDNGHEPDETEWAYTYSLPDDFLMARRLKSGNRIERVNERIPFDLQMSVHGEFILVSDYNVAFDGGTVLEYTARITDVTKFPDHFIETLAYKLASQMAMPLAVRVDMARLARDGYRATLADAWTIEARGFQPDAPPESEFISGR